MAFVLGWSTSGLANAPWTTTTKFNDVAPQDTTTSEISSGFGVGITAGLDTITIPASPVQTLKAVIKAGNTADGWTCQYSNDGTTWTTVGVVTTGTSGVFLTKQWTLGGISARYYRIYSGSANGDSFSVADLRIYDAGGVEITTSGTLTTRRRVVSQVY